jgi:KDO2-lipid IV(A) lauroyltransferase
VGGVVAVTAHVGPWELTGQMLRPDLDVEAVVVMGREANEEAREFQDRIRNERGMRVLHIGDHPTDAIPLIAHLKDGGLAAMQLDRVPPSGRVLDVSLFGQPFRVPEGPFRLASIGGAALVPVFARRLGFFEYELEVSEPIRLGRRPRPEELLAAAQTATLAMQAFIERSPTQWFHFPREERQGLKAPPGPVARDKL